MDFRAAHPIALGQMEEPPTYSLSGQSTQQTLSTVQTDDREVSRITYTLPPYQKVMR